MHPTTAWLAAGNSMPCPVLNHPSLGVPEFSEDDVLSLIREHMAKASQKIAALEAEKAALIAKTQPQLGLIARELETSVGKRKQELMLQEY